MRRLTLRERDVLPVGLADGLSEVEAAAFARLEPALPAGALTWEHKAIRVGPFCGILRAGAVTLELLPKIDHGKDSNEAARGLLIAMLHGTRSSLVTDLGTANLAQQRLHLLDRFILDFCAGVNAALRYGAIVRYEEYEDNLHALRGRLLLTHHTRKNAIVTSQIYCGFDERTIDNTHNRALKAVLWVLRSVAINSQVKAVVSRLLHRFDQVTSVGVTARGIRLLTFNRMTNYWEPVFRQAAWLIEGLFPDVRHGTVEGACLLFNMERLFEAFIGAKLAEAWRHHPSVKTVLQGPQRNLARSETEEAFRMRPDVTILRKEDILRIFDVKWKRLKPTASGWGIEPSDVYQLAAYAGRYRCEQVGLIYPAAFDCRAGLVREYTLDLRDHPRLEIYAVDVRQLCRGGPLPAEMLPHGGVSATGPLLLNG